MGWNGRGTNGHGAWDGDPELELIFPDEPELQQTAQLLQRGRSAEPPLDPAFRAALRRRLMQEAWERAAPALPWWRQLLAPRAMAWAGATVGVLLIAVVVYTLTFRPTPPSTQVVVSSPLQGARAVAATRPIELKFSQPMDTSSVEQSIQIQPATTVRTYQWVDETTVQIVPQHGLAPNTQYQVTVNEKAKTRNGVGLGGQPVVTFVTAPPPTPRTAPSPAPTTRPTPPPGITTPRLIAASGTPSPAWSLDGSVLYVVGPGGQLQAFTVDTGAAQSQVAADGVTLATVGPDGSVVYARSGQVVTGQTSIPGVQPTAIGFQNGRLLAVVNGQVQSLTGAAPATAPSSLQNATAADFSPNGQRLAYLGASGLHVVDLTAGGQDTAVGAASGLGSWSKDSGKYVYPASDGVYVTDGTSQGTRLVSLSGAASVSWSTADQLLIATPSALLIADEDGTGLRTLAIGSFGHATWSSNDTSFWFKSNGSVWVASVLPSSGGATAAGAEDLVNQFMMARRTGNAALANSLLDANGKHAFSNLTLIYGSALSRYYTLLVQPDQAVVRMVLNSGSTLDETLKISRDSDSGNLRIDGVTEEPATLSSGPNMLEAVVTSTQVRVTFDSDLDASSVAAGGVTINGVHARASYDAGTRTVILTPDDPLTSGTQYTLEINGSLKDVDHSSASGYSLTFTGPSS